MSRVETEHFYRAIISSDDPKQTRTMTACLLLVRVFFGVLSLLLTSTTAQYKSFNPSTSTCSAPVRTQLEAAPLSQQQQDLLEKILPQPTSHKPAVRGELRGPLHIPCQLASFPYLQQFVDNVRQYKLPNFEVG
ncbi:hypothetical protein DVH05_020989 [Phytophthora capsici]|nr:hypothetical protein DVH05_020989 [Phytophthora capsici]